MLSFVHFQARTIGCYVPTSMHTMLLLMQFSTLTQTASIDAVITYSAAHCSLHCTAFTQHKHSGHPDCLQQSRLFLYATLPQLSTFLCS